MKALKDSGAYDLVPNETSLEWEMANIGTAVELEQRVNQLRRISQNVRDDSYTPVEYYGATVPRYLANEIENTKKIVNLARRKALMSSYPGWDEMGERQRSTIEATGNMGELRGRYVSGEDLQDLIAMHYHETDTSYMEQYIAEWHKYCVVREYEEKVVDDIRYIVNNHPDALRTILDMGYQQAQIDYIYLDTPPAEGSGLSMSASWVDIGTRHRDIVSFWANMRSRLENGTW